MTERLNVADYHDEPLLELVVPRSHKWNFFEATVWKLRQPVEADFFRVRQVSTAFELRKALYMAEKAKLGQELGKRAAKMAAEMKAANPEVDPDPEMRAYMARETAAMSGPDPENVTPRYKMAEILTIFIEPQQTPERILALGPDIMGYLDAKLSEAFSGEAAKKHLAQAGSAEPSPETSSTGSTQS